MQYKKEGGEPEWFYSSSITITGASCTGTSSALEHLKAYYFNPQMRFVSVGNDIMRRYAHSLGMSIEEFVRHMKNHPEEGWDKRCDAEIEEYGTKNNLIVEGRLPHIFVRHAFHVFLDCPLEIRAERRQRQDKYRQLSICEVKKLLRSRDENDASRYTILYPGCLWQKEEFNLYINTATATQEEVAEEIFRAHFEWKEEWRNSLVWGEFLSETSV